MEYDNDTLRRRTSRIEIFGWILLGLLSPVTDCITMLTAHWASCITAIVVGGLIFPLYLLYARFAGVLFLDHRRRILPWLLSIGSFFVIQLFIFGSIRHHACILALSRAAGLGRLQHPYHHPRQLVGSD
jgi:hypothetical protein